MDRVHGSPGAESANGVQDGDAAAAAHKGPIKSGRVGVKTSLTTRRPCADWPQAAQGRLLPQFVTSSSSCGKTVHPYGPYKRGICLDPSRFDRAPCAGWKSIRKQPPRVWRGANRSLGGKYQGHRGRIREATEGWYEGHRGLMYNTAGAGSAEPLRPHEEPPGPMYPRPDVEMSHALDG